MGTYYIARNTKGEGRILFIFTAKSLIYTTVGIIIGIIFYMILNAIKLGFVGLIIIAVLALIGFAIGTVKVPKLNGIKFTHDIAGERLDDIILRYIKYRRNRNKVYIYTEEQEQKNVR